MRTATHRNTENTRAILPMARILLRMTSFRRLAVFSAHGREVEEGQNSIRKWGYAFYEGHSLNWGTV